ncbi:MAG: RNA 2',3'-cyclic phosphodiesterase [Eubacterium sp.]|nr:RNA 2',3'-cyclic phosphodiesterase [Eubacterium sp.]
MRLFVAIELEENIKDALIEVQGSMKKAGVSGNFTPIENTHLTIAFIGEYSDPDQVLEAMSNVEFSPFKISLEGFGHFNDLWWVGLEKSPELNSLVKSLRHNLADQGIPFDKKKFSPHITVVRRAICKKGLPGVSVPNKSMSVDKITLFKSERGKHGMIYTEIGSIY